MRSMLKFHPHAQLYYSSTRMRSMLKFHPHALYVRIPPACTVVLEFHPHASIYLSSEGFNPPACFFWLNRKSV